MDLKDLNVVKDDVIVTRSSSKVKFVSDFTSLTRVQNNPLYRGIALWNTLREDIKKMKSK